MTCPGTGVGFKLTILKKCRAVAQLVAHLVWDQGVASSNPAGSTIFF